MARGRKTGGRKPGTPNKRTAEVVARLESLDCDPIEGMVRIAEEEMAKEDGDRALAGSMYRELAQYVFPKRRAVEVGGDPAQPPVRFQLILGGGGT